MTGALDPPGAAGVAPVMPATSRGAFALITGLFVFSGATGLVYQVLWMRSLGLFFGSDIFAISIILSTFMGGLAIGSFVGGHIAERSSRPLLWYGVAEAGIGLFALRFHALLGWFDPILRAAYVEGGGLASWSYELTRVGLASGVLLIPTSLMGATLPLILRHFVHTGGALGRVAAHFYGVNTLGAMAGTLTAGFVLLPYLGMSASTTIVAVVNLSIGVSCILFGIYSTPAPDLAAAAGTADAPQLDALPGVEPERRTRIARAALIAFGVSGLGSFALEVVWTRSLLMSASATVYSFSAMLVCFLFGIFAGSLVVARSVDREREPLRLFSRLELAVGAYIAILCLMTNALPRIFGAAFSTASALSGGGGFDLVIATLGTSFVLLLVPTMLLGATFSVALRSYTMSVAHVGTRTGYLYFSNTLGAIVGSLAAGFLLIPALGIKGSLALIAALFAANGLYLARVQMQSLRGVEGLLAGVTLAAAVVGILTPYQVTLNFNQRIGEGSDLLYHAEGIQSTIDVVRAPSGATALIIGGNVEADDSITQRRHFVLKGHLPLMVVEDPKDVLVVGLGMGITLAATARHEGLERIDVIELSPEIVEAQKVLASVNGDIVSNPLVHIRIDDGRNYLKMTSATYDMVTADPIHPKIARVGYLYTREYYQSIRARLAAGGVVCQWMPIYQMSPRRLRSAVKTFIEVFPNSMLWYVKNHVLLVAKPDSAEIDFQLLQRKFRLSSVREDLGSIGVESPEQLLALLLMGPEQIRAFVDAEPDVPLNTDDYPYLEYSVPGDLFYRPVENVRQMVRHLVDPTRLTIHQSAESIAEVHRLIAGRAERLVEETQ